MKISACGLICDECEYYTKECNGCIAVSGQTMWAKEMMPNHTCPLFDCAVNKKGFKNCGQCYGLPCEMFRQMKDPNITDKEHKLSLVQRVTLLKKSVK